MHLMSSATRKLCYRKDDRAMRSISGSNELLRRCGHSKLSKMAACRQVGFDVTVNSAVWSADPENPTLEPNMNCIGSPVAEIWPFAYLGAYGTPILGGRGGRSPGQRWHHSKERWWFPLVTVALSVTIRPQFVIECLRRSNQQGWVNLAQNFRVFLLE